MALGFLVEAEKVPAAIVPRVATHAAYYAMFHAARAVLVKLDGANAPTKHGAVVSRFGFFAKQANDETLMSAGHAINRVQKERLQNDYDSDRSPAPAAAVLAVKAARLFIETCARVHDFPPP